MSYHNVIIMAGGEAKRWKNHTGRPKHWLQIGNYNSLIDRISCQVLRLNERIKITVVIPPATDPAYSTYLEYIREVRMSLCSEIKLSTRCGASALYELTDSNLYNKTYFKTTVLFGDVWFTHKAISKILNAQFDDYIFIGRKDKNIVTGLKYGELWGLSFKREAYLTIIQALAEVNNLLTIKKIARAGGWQIYKHMQDLDQGAHAIKNNFLEINDLTEDFDTPEDYEGWKEFYDGS